MAIFQTKKIQSFIVFIIVLAAILWIFQDNILNISVFKKTTEVSELSEEQIKDTPYLEKIDNFIIKEYSSDQVLLHTIEADVYKSFKDSPVQLEIVTVTTFDEKQNRSAVFLMRLILNSWLLKEIKLKVIETFFI